MENNHKQQKISTDSLLWTTKAWPCFCFNGRNTESGSSLWSFRGLALLFWTWAKRGLVDPYWSNVGETYRLPVSTTISKNQVVNSLHARYILLFSPESHQNFSWSHLPLVGSSICQLWWTDEHTIYMFDDGTPKGLLSGLGKNIGVFLKWGHPKKPMAFNTKMV